MGLNKKALSIIIVATIIVSTLAIVLPIVFLDNKDDNVGILEDFILITKESDFTEKYQFPGNGTASSPYRIENLTNSGKQPEMAIGIYNVSCIFTIRNCSITARRFCIYLYNVTGFNSTISDNNCIVDTIGMPGPEGVAIEACISEGIIIQNNYCTTTIWRRSWGILLNRTSYTTVIDNTCIDFGIGIIQTISVGGWGVYEEDICINNTIRGNYCFGNLIGIYSESSGWLAVLDNICSNNSNGMSIQHVLQFENQSTLIKNNTNIFNYGGLYVRSLPMAEISENNCSFNSYYGMSINLCYGNISKNKCINNTNGILLTNQDSYFYSNQACYIYSNNIINNTEHGLIVFLATGNEWIFSNNLIDNNQNGTEFGIAQAFEEWTVEKNNYTTWYNPLTLVGNYWSDLLWDGIIEYEIDGGNSTDPYTLEYPVIF